MTIFLVEQNANVALVDRRPGIRAPDRSHRDGRLAETLLANPRLSQAYLGELRRGIDGFRPFGRGSEPLPPGPSVPPQGGRDPLRSSG